MIGLRTWSLAKVQEVANALSFYRRGSILSLIFSLYGFRGTGWFPLPYFKLPLTTFSDVHIHFLSTPVVKIEPYFLFACSSFRDMGRFSKLAYLGMKLDHWQKIQNLHISSLSAHIGWKLSLYCLYFHSRGSSFRDIGRFSKLPYLGMKLGHWQQIQKLHIYPLSTPRGRNWAYFRSTGSGFRDTGQISKLPYLGMKLDHRPKFQKLHIYSLSTPWGRNWAYFRSTGSGFSDTDWFSKLPYSGMKHGHWPKLYIYSLYTPRGRNWDFFSLYGQRFPRYGSIFKIAIFGHETWSLAKVPEVAHVLSFYPRRGRNWAYFCSKVSSSEIWADFQNSHIWAWTWVTWQKIQKLYISCLSTLGIEIELIFVLRAAVFETLADFQNFHIWAWNLAIAQSFRSCTYTP